MIYSNDLMQMAITLMFGSMKASIKDFCQMARYFETSRILTCKILDHHENEEKQHPFLGSY